MRLAVFGLFFALTAASHAAQAADDAPLRPSARLLFKAPELLRAGECVRYEEGGAGWVMTEPVYYLKGEVVSAEVQTRHVGHCPVVPGKRIEHYSRAEFVRHARAYPCVSASAPERDEQIGIVRVRVQAWETPHERRTENMGRLYRGMFLDQRLEKDMEIELEADLLGLCGT
jgi:hypothetical protein